MSYDCYNDENLLVIIACSKLSEILIPLDTLLCQKRDIVRKPAGESIRNSDNFANASSDDKNLFY